ncbi:hypothetical protein ASD65_09655 [Microbacterium sp. Root61]|nr:hypothetical protein ASD65_09655 [Microbacterium sp. Root61]
MLGLVSTHPPSDPAPSGRRFGWVRVAADRVPTKWFAGIGTVAFLAATAAFGGLATAAVDGPAVIDTDTEHRNEQIAITVQRAVLLDEFPEAGIHVEDGERVLAVQVRLENVRNEPQSASPGSDVAKNFSIAELDGEPAGSAARLDDATTSPVLQPGVPAEIVYTWAIDADDFHAGDTLHVTLNDLSLHVGSFVTIGSWWIDPVPAATLTVALTDVGSGADSDGTSE